MNIRFEERPSPNHDERGGPVDILLLHYTGMVDAETALRRLTDPQAKVSSHWFVDEDGRIIRLVDEERRAWHAGVSIWAGESDINTRSVGIEIHNPGHDWGYRDFPYIQIEAVIRLCRDILGRHPIPPHRVLAHSDVAPGRKIDPGEKFPWQRLNEAGVGHWVPPLPIAGEGGLSLGTEGQAVLTLQNRLSAYGYGLEATGRYDAATQTVVSAFQLHFRQQLVDGIADSSTCATLDRLIEAHPQNA